MGSRGDSISTVMRAGIRSTSVIRLDCVRLRWMEFPVPCASTQTCDRTDIRAELRPPHHRAGCASSAHHGCPAASNRICVRGNGTRIAYGNGGNTVGCSQGGAAIRRSSGNYLSTTRTLAHIQTAQEHMKPSMIASHHPRHPPLPHHLIHRNRNTR